MNTRCPKCQENASFHGTFDHDRTEIILDGAFGILGLAVGLPLLMTNTFDALRIVGASLAILSTWSLMVMLVRQVHLSILKRDSTRWPPESEVPPETHQE